MKTGNVLRRMNLTKTLMKLHAVEVKMVSLTAILKVFLTLWCSSVLALLKVYGSFIIMTVLINNFSTKIGHYYVFVV